MSKKGTRRTLSIASIALASLLSASFAHAISNEELEAEAARQFAQMKATLPLTTDQEIIDYVSCVANAVVIALEPPGSDLRWEMAIFEEDAINAMAMPGGKIIIFEGILKAARDQDQLAAVIGHEIAHVTANHSKRKYSKALMSDLGVQVAAVLIGQGHGGATYSAYEALRQGAMFGFFLPFSRAAESEADVIGLQFMAKAGFDPRAAVPLWQNMSSETGEDPPEFISTHPSDDKRIESLISQWVDVLPLYNQALEAGRRPSCAVPASLVERLEKEAAKKKKLEESQKR